MTLMGCATHLSHLSLLALHGSQFIAFLERLLGRLDSEESSPTADAG